MTGLFKPIVIYNSDDPRIGWLTHSDSMTNKGFGVYIPLSGHIKLKDSSASMLTSTLYRNYGHYTSWNENDKKRKLNVNEYLELGMALRTNKLRYNKKKDSLYHRIEIVKNDE